MDAASGSARLGADEVVLAYRGRKDDMGAYGFEYDFAIGAGVRGLFNASPLEILGKNKVEGVRFIKTESANGKLSMIEGSEFTIECDMVIKATGQAKQGSLLRLIDGLELDNRTRIVVNPDTNQTTNPMYFAGGDAINGGAEVVNGAYDGKLAANGIHELLTQH
jgi:glutamate synthase (NADPH/NADH) small chain